VQSLDHAAQCRARQLDVQRSHHAIVGVGLTATEPKASPRGLKSPRGLSGGSKGACRQVCGDWRAASTQTGHSAQVWGASEVCNACVQAVGFPIREPLAPALPPGHTLHLKKARRC
jgi:hypothetical protein